MIANAALLAALTVFLFAGWLAGELRFLAPYKAVLFHEHAALIGGVALILFLNLTATYYSGIRVPATNVVGEVDGGWRLITAQLNHERVALAALGGRMIQLWEQVLGWACDTGALEVPWVRSELARAHAQLEAMQLMNWKLTAAVADGSLTGTTAGAAKTYGTETHIAVQRTLSHVLGAGGRIRPGSPAAVLHGQVEQLSRQGIVNTFGGGVNEVLRDMIATQGLGLPRSRR